jgi:hypothetical protein
MHDRGGKIRILATRKSARNRFLGAYCIPQRAGRHPTRLMGGGMGKHSLSRMIRTYTKVGKQ